MLAGGGRIAAVLVVLGALCLSAVPAAGQEGAGQQSEVRVVDGSFEALWRDPSVRTWVLNGKGSVDDSTAYDGQASARLAGPNRYQSEWVHPFAMPLVPGREYVVAAWVRATGDGSVASLGIRWPGGDTRIYRGLRPDEEWQRMELLFRVPDPAPAWIQIVLTGEHSRDLWWDSVTIAEAQTIRERLAREWAPRLASGEQLYTGLVINAKGLGVTRGMSPKIYDEDGRIVYAGLGATTDLLIGSGIVAYATELQDAIRHPRLSVDPNYPLRHPLVIDAIDGADNPRTGVVISRYDAQVLFAALNEYDFLGRFAVVFVVDKPF